MASETDHNLLADLTVGQIIAALVTLGVIIGFVRNVAPILKRLNNLLDDWFGQPARPGVRERKGVMQRLADQDAAIADLHDAVRPIVDGSTPGNHNEVLTEIAAVKGKTETNSARLKTVERLLRRHIRESKTWVHQVDEHASKEGFALPAWPSEDDEDPLEILPDDPPR